MADTMDVVSSHGTSGFTPAPRPTPPPPWFLEPGWKSPKHDSKSIYSLIDFFSHQQPHEWNVFVHRYKWKEEIDPEDRDDDDDQDDEVRYETYDYCDVYCWHGEHPRYTTEMLLPFFHHEIKIPYGGKLEVSRHWNMYYKMRSDLFYMLETMNTDPEKYKVYENEPRVYRVLCVESSNPALQNFFDNPCANCYRVKTIDVYRKKKKMSKVELEQVANPGYKAVIVSELHYGDRYYDWLDRFDEDDSDIDI